MESKQSFSVKYLSRNPYSYCFRLKIPIDLQVFLGRKELRYSLKTGYLSLAKNRARLMAGIFQDFKDQVRRIGNVHDLTDELIKRIVTSMARSMLKAFEEIRLQSWKASKTERDSNSILYDRIKEMIDRQSSRSLENMDYSFGKLIATGFLEQYGIEVDKNSRQFEKLCHDVLIGLQRAAKIGGQWKEGNFDTDIETVFPSGEILYKKDILDSEPEIPVKLSDLIEAYLTEQRSLKRKPKVIDEYRTSCNLLLEYLDDVPINKISRKKIADFKAALEKLPSNRKKKPQYRDKTMQEVLAMDIPEKDLMHISNVRKNFTRIVTLFKFAKTFGNLQDNPAEGFKFRKTDDDDSNRLPFTQDELERLFRSKEYLNDTHEHAFQFWSSILGLFMMARQTEIGQLYVDDFKHEDGLWVIEIKQVEGETSVKYKASKRKLPIHPFLLHELNLIGYVNGLKSKGEKRLFPELKKGKYGYGEKISKWFCSTYRVKCGIDVPEGKYKDFHSFRKTVSIHLDVKKVHDGMFSQAFGHSIGKSTRAKHYLKYTPQQILDEVISKISFDQELDLSHLKNSKWVVKP